MERIMTGSFGRAKSVPGPAILFLLLLLRASRIDDLSPFLALHVQHNAKPVAGDILQTGLWPSGGWVLVQLVDLLVWDGVVTRAIGVRVPGLLKTLSSFIIASLAVTGSTAVSENHPSSR
jgi:hypothetical protein